MGHRIYTGGGPADIRERSISLSASNESYKEPTKSEVVASFQKRIGTHLGIAQALPPGPERESHMDLADLAEEAFREWRNIYNYRGQ